MRLTPIPSEEVPKGYQTVVLAAPDGDLTNPDIAPAEMAVKQHKDSLIYSARFILEEGDIESLQEGYPIWLTLWGNVPPFNVDIGNLA